VGVRQKFKGKCYPLCSSRAEHENDTYLRGLHDVPDDRDTLAAGWVRFTKRDAVFEAKATPGTKEYEGELGVIKQVTGAIIYPEADPKLKARARYDDYAFTTKLRKKVLDKLQPDQLITLIVYVLRRRPDRDLTVDATDLPRRGVNTAYNLREKVKKPTPSQMVHFAKRAPSPFKVEREEMSLKQFLEYTVIGAPATCTGFAAKLVEIIPKIECLVVQKLVIQYVAEFMIPIVRERDVREGGGTSVLFVHEQEHPYVGRMCYIPSTVKQEDIGDQFPVAALAKRFTGVVVGFSDPPPDRVFECLYTTTLRMKVIMLDLQIPTMKTLEGFEIPSVGEQIQRGREEEGDQIILDNILFRLADEEDSRALSVSLKKMYFLQCKLVNFDEHGIRVSLNDEVRMAMEHMFMSTVVSEQRIQIAVEFLSFLCNVWGYKCAETPTQGARCGVEFAQAHQHAHQVRYCTRWHDVGLCLDETRRKRDREAPEHGSFHLHWLQFRATGREQRMTQKSSAK